MKRFFNVFNVFMLILESFHNFDSGGAKGYITSTSSKHGESLKLLLW